MVLTEQAETECYIAATVEDASWATENTLYNIVDTRRISKSTVVDAENIASFGAKIYRVNGNSGNEKTGLGIMLKVMKGDQLKISAESYYNLPGGGAGSPTQLLATELLSALVGGPGFPTGKGLTSSDLTNIINNSSTIQSFINTNTGTSTRAKAAVNWVLFDEQMRFAAGGFDPVQENGGYKNHTQYINNPVDIIKNGYLYIYVSNESNFNVFFDNLNVSHTNGPILEETHYYPFGLTMAGISSKALNGAPENKYKYNDGSELENKEFSDGGGLDIYSTEFRSYDPQIGKLLQKDPLDDLTEDISLYAYAINNPILYNDPFGLTSNKSGISFEQNAITDWVRDETTGKVYFDPDVTGPNNVKLGQNYIGPEIFITDDDGNIVGFGNDQSRISYNNELPEIVVAGKKKSNNKGNTIWSWTKNKTSDFVSPFVYVGTTINSSVFNAGNELIHEGIHDGGAYNLKYYSTKIYKLENWKTGKLKL